MHYKPSIQRFSLKTALRDVNIDRPVVVDSIRFAADLAYARKNGFYVLRIDATSERRKKWLTTRGQEFDWFLNGQHAAETELDNATPDAIITNDSTVDRLISKCMQVLTASPT